MDPTRAPSVNAVSGQVAAPLTLDEKWAALAANEIPGFAGIAGDGNGVDEILLVDETQRSKAQAYARRVSQEQGVAPTTTRVRHVDFAFDQLMTWRLLLLPLLGVNGIHSLDIDEVRNRVALGVKLASDITAVRNLAVGAGVPAEALVVEVMPVIKPRVLLTDEAPVTVGGYEIASAPGICSLGFNTYTLGSTGNVAFMTAEGNWNVTWFSSLNGIDRDFGRTFKVCSPDVASC
jgi:hypothetical protein